MLPSNKRYTFKLQNLITWWAKIWIRNLFGFVNGDALIIWWFPISCFNYNNCYLLFINYYYSNNYKKSRKKVSTKSKYCSVGVMEFFLNLLILIDCFLCNSYPFVLFESVSYVINQESHVYSWNLGKIYLVHSSKFWNLKKSQNFKKVSSVNLSQISLLNIWLLVQISVGGAY